MLNKKKILLISNFENTQFYHKLFYNFKKNLEIYWYVVNESNYQFLKKHYDETKIIYINKKNFKDLDHNNLFDDIKLNEILSTDRALGDTQENFDYLNKIASYMSFFLKKENFSFIFSEYTWSYEILISRIARSLNIPFYNMQSTRYPSNRFIFFSNERQNEFYLRNKKANESSFYDDDNLYEKYIEKKKNENNDIFFILKKSFNLLFETYFDKHDPTYTSKIKRIISFLRKKIISIFYSFLKKKNIKNISENYFIYFLQKQPEATTDVKGMYYSNQIENIKIIWKILPVDFMFIIKEHPNCIGDRSLAFYKEILKLKNVYLSDGKNFGKIIKNSKATFSIASTASLKSSLMNIPSFTLTETFFNCLDFSFRISIEDIRNSKNFFF